MVLAWANANRVPVTAWGGGSSLEGNPIPVRGGVVMDMTRMNRMLEVLAGDFQARVQPGIIGDELNKQLKSTGLFFPAFPGSSNIATVGGMIANNAGGMYAVRYGVVGDNVLELEVVLASGEVIRTGSRSIKNVAGYDLTRLFVGSEGTLGVVTEATLRLAGIPSGKIAILVTFPAIEDAIDSVLDLLGAGLQVAALELMDTRYVKFVNQAKKLNWAETPTLLIELHGLLESIAIELPMIEDVTRSHKGIIVETATTTQAQNRLWEGRRAVRHMVRTLLPGMGVLAGDIGVPISQVPELFHQTYRLGEKHNIQTMAYGHAGDGNFHCWAIYSEGDDESRRHATTLHEELTGWAISVGGTSAAEHGLGLGKRKYLPLQLGTAMPHMAAIKRLFDPHGILNPGKIFPDK
jgi:D-lactate dehydrogenase (cytochrome)